MHDAQLAFVNRPTPVTKANNPADAGYPGRSNGATPLLLLQKAVRTDVIEGNNRVAKPAMPPPRSA